MQKHLPILLVLILLFTSFSAAAEISPIPVITDFETPLQKQMWTFASRQQQELAVSIETFGASYWDEWFPDMPLSKLLPLLRGGVPENTVFFACPDYKKLMHKEKLSTGEEAALRGRILSASLYSTCALNAFTAAFIDGLSVYSIWNDAPFHGAAYVISLYGDGLPCTITAFIEDGNGQTIAKTSLIYTEGAMDGSEFQPIAQYLTSQWGWDGETFDIRILNRIEEDTAKQP